MTLTSEEVGHVTVIHVKEKYIDALNAPIIKADILSQLKPKMQVVLDLSDVEFVDSSGMGAILSTVRHLTGMDGKLKLAGVRKEVRALFELVRFQRIIEIYTAVDEAVTAYSVTK